jgi:hypothetical protein
VVELHRDFGKLAQRFTDLMPAWVDTPAGERFRYSHLWRETRCALWDLVRSPNIWGPDHGYGLDLPQRVAIEAGQQDDLGDPDIMATVRQKVADAPKARIVIFDDVVEFSVTVLEQGLANHRKPAGAAEEDA